MGEINPGLILIAGALVVPLLGGWLRSAWLLALPVLAFAQTVGLQDGVHGALTLFDLELTTLRVDRLSLAFAWAFLVALFFCMVYLLHLRDALQPMATLAYAGSAVGAVFAGDLVTLFLFWEGTSIASVFLILAARTEAALAASMRYLVFQVGSGVLLLAGAMVALGDTGSIAFESFEVGTVAGTILLVAFGIKAAFPLLHGWLKDAYPEATVTGTVVLSVFTTKLAIYALARGFAGADVLIPIGATMAVFPIVGALLESDYRRVLSWGLNSQLGFMVVGVGIGTDLALNGAVAHAICSMIYQALLFMALGAVLYRTGTIQGVALGGLARQMPWTTGFYLAGAASISAMPVFSGFVSKSMIVSASGYEHLFYTWLALQFAGAVTFVYAGLRVPFGAFFGEPAPGPSVREAPANMLVAMAIAAGLSLFIGLWPDALYSILPRDYEYHPWTAEHVLTQLQLLGLAALVFVAAWRFGLFPADIRAVHLDPDWLWRRPIARLGRRALVGGLFGWGAFFGRVQSASARLARLLSTQHGPTGALARTRPSGAMAFWMTVMLLAFLGFSFL